MNIKNELRKKLTEAKYLVSPENLDQVVDDMGDSDTVKVVDENEEHNGRIAPMELDPEFEKLSKSEERVSEYNFIKPKMTKKEIQETVLKIINNGK